VCLLLACHWLPLTTSAIYNLLTILIALITLIMLIIQIVLIALIISLVSNIIKDLDFYNSRLSYSSTNINAKNIRILKLADLRNFYLYIYSSVLLVYILAYINYYIIYI